MAVSSEALAARENTDFAADKPLVAVQAIPIAPTLVRWNDEGTTAGADHTLSTAPCRRAYDGFAGFVTSPDTTADNEWYLVFNLGALVTFDCAFIIGHSFGSLALTNVTIEVADDGDFAGPDLLEIADFGSPANDDRLADYVLKHEGAVALRYTAQFVRLRLNNGGGANFTPSLRELVLGRRYQMDRKPDRPWDELAYANSEESDDSESGVDYLTTRYRNRHTINAEWPVEDTSYIADWRAFWTNCRGTFVWNDAPTSAPNSWRFMVRKQTETDFARLDGGGRMARLIAHEQGPEQYFLANE
jgi:hypothetical protein